ncbi:MAG: hypothetical protein Q4D93_00935 [Porphyromonas sp.]|nr:hypothetical protein [Porphyromonas sp.]
MAYPTKDNEWHDVLNNLRIKLRREMSGDVSMSMQEKGVQYGINFGVTLPKLQEMAGSLPQQSSLAELMWSKDVREMKLLAIMLLEQQDPSPETVYQMIAESPTLEMSEQIVIRLVAQQEWAPELALRLWKEQGSISKDMMTTSYIILTRLAFQRAVPAKILDLARRAITRDLSQDPAVQLQTYILRALSTMVEKQPELRPWVSELAFELASNDTDTPPYLIGTELLSLIDFIEAETTEERP